MEEELKQNTQQPKDGQSASPKHMSIRSILGGDILANDFFKRQTRLLILIMILTVLYIDNRYSSQQELIEIDKLKKDLIDIKYDALTRSSELMEKSRQSRIEEYISTDDSPLQTATANASIESPTAMSKSSEKPITQPPFVNKKRPTYGVCHT